MRWVLMVAMLAACKDSKPHRCDAVPKHIRGLMQSELGDSNAKAIRDECVKDWSDAHYDCVMAATTFAAMKKCEHEFRWR
jgi:hypothetical protein